MNGPLRTLAVIHGPAYGGAHNQLVQLAGPLQEQGVEITAVLPEEAAAAAARMREGGVETLTIDLGRLRASPDPRLHARLLGGLRDEVRALRELIAERRIDVVQVHGATNPHGAIAARGVPGTGLVWQLFDTRAPMALRRLAMPYVVRAADLITVWGEALADAHPASRSLGDRLVPVYPPLDERLFSPSEEARARGRERLGLDSDALAVGTVAVLNPQKGHQHLIDAFALAAARLGDGQIELRILGGSSPAHAAYERGLRERIDTRGIADGTRIADPTGSVPELLAALDVFVLASERRSEGMPTAILEAMALGKPVVATRVGAVAELVEDGVTGLLVDPSDPDALSAAIGRLVADVDLREAFGGAGRRRAQAEFGIGPLAEIHADVYRRARDRARKRAAS